MNGVSVPSRIYHVMATRVFVAVDAGGDAEMTLTLTEHRAGWHLTPNDADGLKRLVRHLDTTERTKRARLFGASA